MSITTKKLHLIERLMQTKEEKVLHYYEELLVKAEMQARAEESLEAIEKGDTRPISEFRKDVQGWKKQQAI